MGEIMQESLPPSMMDISMAMSDLPGSLMNTFEHSWYGSNMAEEAWPGRLL